HPSGDQGNRPEVSVGCFLHLSRRERSDCKAIRVRGYDLSVVLTPTLSPAGSGSAPRSTSMKPYCGVMLRLLMILPHFSASVLMPLPSSSGVDEATSTAMSAIFLVTSGSARIRAISVLSRVTRSPGIPAGPYAPYHTVIS